jgi:hypothetical protein
MSAWIKFGVACVAVGLLVQSTAALAAEEGLAGRWKLVILSSGESNQAIIEIKGDQGAYTGEPVALPAGSTIPTVEQKGDQVTVVLDVGGNKYEFAGKLVSEGDDAGRMLGVFGRGGTVSPARLEKTADEKLLRLTVSPLLTKVAAIERDKETAASERVEKLEALLADAPAAPANQRAYQAILNLASEAKLSDEQLGQHIEKWLADAKKYGSQWVDQCRINAIRALDEQQPYAELALQLAQQAEKALGDDASLEQQATVVALLASAARGAGKEDLAKVADERSAKIETALDEEYHRTVPPFEPKKFTGRDDPNHTRVVLMELFTGAQCPPCVAADVGFDVLLKTYQPTELVTLQYHLHIPGPDPLTNADTVERSKYYAVRGTPSTYFNGAMEAYGGGGMANAEKKYDQYREVIDTRLKDARAAEIKLNVTRSGDSIIVAGSAQAKLPPAEKDAANTKDKPGSDKEKSDQASDEKEADKPMEPKLRLRLALTEESIRYVGGNKLRFHHHVVRALPGGAEGLEMVAGQCQVNQTIDLAEVRKSLEEYLSSDERKYPYALPEIRLEDLSLVAFVQDDSDKSVWHAVTIDVPQAK